MGQVIKFGGREISAEDLEAAMVLLEKSRNKRTKSEFTPVERRVRGLLLAQKAEEAKLVVTKEEIAAYIAKMKKREPRKPVAPVVDPEA